MVNLWKPIHEFKNWRYGSCHQNDIILLSYHIWFKINVEESKKRHILKTVTWRLIGTIDTMVLARIVSGNPLKGISIGFAEIVTKMGLYYFHERIWYRIDFGVEKTRRLKR